MTPGQAAARIDGDVDAAVEVLRDAIGLDPDVTGRKALEAAVAARRSARSLGSGEAYGPLLRDPAEVQRLVDEVVVPETWFFRDPAAFALLGRAATAWRSAGEPVRVLCAPCASGEEAYSVAITLLSAGIPPAVLGIDASERLLAIAERGAFSTRALRGPVPSEPFVRPLPDGGFEVAPEVRACVRFRRGSLTSPHPLEGELPFHAIFCRNLLIYLTRPARRQCLAVLVERLAPGGLMFAGHAEALSVMDPRFRPVAQGEAFAFTFAEMEVARRAAPVSRSPAARPGPVAASRGPARAMPAPAAGVAAAATAAGAAADPSPHGSSPMLAEAASLADRGHLERALSVCRAHLATHPFDVHAAYLEGVIVGAGGDRDRAEASFRRVLQLDAAHYESLVRLALICEQRGEAAAARRYRERAGAASARRASP